MKSKMEVRSETEKLIDRTGWVYLAGYLVVFAVVTGFSMNIWGALIVGALMGVVFVFTDKWLANKFMERLYGE